MIIEQKTIILESRAKLSPMVVCPWHGRYGVLFPHLYPSLRSPHAFKTQETLGVKDFRWFRYLVSELLTRPRWFRTTWIDRECFDEIFGIWVLSSLKTFHFSFWKPFWIHGILKINRFWFKDSLNLSPAWMTHFFLMNRTLPHLSELRFLDSFWSREAKIS